MKKMLYKQKMTKLKNPEFLVVSLYLTTKLTKKLLFLVSSPYRMWSYLKNLSEMHFESWH